MLNSGSTLSRGALGLGAPQVSHIPVAHQSLVRHRYAAAFSFGGLQTYRFLLH